MGDQSRDDEAIKDLLYQGLSEKLKDELSWHGSLDKSLEAFLTNWKNLDNIVQARHEERRLPGDKPDSQSSYLAARTSGRTRRRYILQLQY